MKDQFGREVDYLRLSITDNCNLRCVYCMPENEKNKIENNNLTIEEYFEVVKIFSKLGIKKVRITGGEPLVRKGIDNLVKNIHTIKEIEEIAITTNGLLLDKYLDTFIENGVTSLNISIDSVNYENYKNITRGGNLDKVVNLMKKAIKNNIKVKINAVIIKGVNDKEIVDLVLFAIENNVDIRFIELMPIGCARNLKGIKSEKIIEILNESGKIKILDENNNVTENILEKSNKRNGPAQYYKLKNTNSRLGFISPLSSCFCDTCNRIRVTSDGKIKQCLYYRANIDLKELIRNEKKTKNEILEIVKNQIYTKNRKHEFNNYEIKKEKREERIMSSIGG